MLNTAKEKQNASVTLKELELPEGATITINGICLTSEVLENIQVLGNSIPDYNNVKTCLAKNSMLISANADDDDLSIVDRNFFNYIKIFYEIVEALQDAKKEGSEA